MGSHDEDVRARLTRMVRHDLRGAMNVLHLNLELLTSTDDRMTAAQRTERAAAIQTACGSVCALLPLAVEAWPADDAITSIVAHLRPLFEMRGVTIADEPALGTRADDARTRLVDVLLDVVEKTPRGGKIELAYDPTRRRVLVASSAGPAVTVALAAD